MKHFLSKDFFPKISISIKDATIKLRMKTEKSEVDSAIHLISKSISRLMVFTETTRQRES